MITPEASVLDAGERIAVTLADGTRRSGAAGGSTGRISPFRAA